MIIEQLVKNESSLNPQVRDFRFRLMRNVPTIVCKLGAEKRGSSTDCVSNKDGYAQSSMLYAIVSDVSKYGPLKSTIESLAAFSEWKAERILLVLMSEKPRKKLEGLFKFAWAKKLLDFTIIELIEARVPEELADSVPRPVIHHYNPFKKEYTRINWTPNENFFPRKGLNMWGYRLKIGVLHEPPMSFVKFNESSKIPISLKGANINLVKLMAERLNFTAVWVAFQQFSEIRQDPTPSGLYRLMNSEKIDLLASMSPHHTNSKEYRIQRTSSVMVDRLCPVVPITRTVHVFNVADTIRTFPVVLVILIVFWIPAYLLKFDSRYWKPISIFKLFLGFAWATAPKNNAERVVFACILFLSVIYFNTMFASSTKARFIYDKAASITTFQDLDDSGLTPMVSSFLYNKTFAQDEGSLSNLKKKSIAVSDIGKCPFYAAKHNNICCIMGERDVLLTMVGNEDYRHRLKIVRPCFWFDAYGFLLGKASPYTRYLNTVIFYAHTSGIIAKWYSTLEDIKSEDWLIDLDEDNTSQIDRNNNTSPALVRQLMTIITIGLITSLLVFIGEIIVHRFGY
ncbi:uncharacterized protein [Venturia canescens]|uniref:uncharacterized protein n=1 Tax=Venturia canescens TaxID=32260 RepID=UPI001C9CB90D|nr:uncharacterized protein LOC122413835 [Venturia canescens]